MVTNEGLIITTKDLRVGDRIELWPCGVQANATYSGSFGNGTYNV